MSRKGQTVEQLFPDPRGRRVADAKIDALDINTSIRDAMELWETTYFNTCGSSPFRKPPRQAG